MSAREELRPEYLAKLKLIEKRKGRIFQSENELLDYLGQ